MVFFLFTLRMGTLLLADPTKKKKSNVILLFFLSTPSCPSLLGLDGSIDMEESRKPEGCLVDYKEPHELERIMDFSLPELGVGPEGKRSFFFVSSSLYIRPHAGRSKTSPAGAPFVSLRCSLLLVFTEQSYPACNGHNATGMCNRPYFIIIHYRFASMPPHGNHFYNPQLLPAYEAMG